eukprot:537054-Alexandrium_andersonii.AAC.1
MPRPKSHKARALSSGISRDGSWPRRECCAARVSARPAVGMLPRPPAASPPRARRAMASADGHASRP